MQVFDITFDKILTNDEVVGQFMDVLNGLSIIIQSQGTMKTIPGSIHWHLRRQDQKGTLEAAFVPSRREFWLGYHNNRYAEWMDEVIREILVRMSAK